MSPPAQAHPRRRSVYADRLLRYSAFASEGAASFGRCGSWSSFFRKRNDKAFDGRLVLEIGCSDGATLTSMAGRHPSKAFIGLDWKYRQIFLAAERIEALALNNVALLQGRAQDIRQMVGEAEIDEVLIFQPEPCDRPEEAANQLLTRSFFEDLAYVLKPGGTVSIKTDHARLFQDVVEITATLADLTVAFISHDFWNDDVAKQRTQTRCFANEQTFFERRFIRRRQPIHYVELQKLSDNPSS